MEKIVFKDVTVTVKENPLICQLNLEIPQGETLSVIGESGAGKSILLGLLIGHIPNKAIVTGKRYYHQKNIGQFSEKDWQMIRGETIAYMAQNPMAMFNPFQKIKTHFFETIRSKQRCSKKECLKRAAFFLKKVGLNDPEMLLEQYPFELSGGILQRVMLAILLCLDPQTILLDEPTSALDRYNRDHLIEMLKELKKKGTTLIIVTHDYDLLARLDGQVIVMKKGNIVEHAAVQEILHHPKHPYTQDLIFKNPYERLIERDIRM